MESNASTHSLRLFVIQFIIHSRRFKPSCTMRQPLPSLTESPRHSRATAAGRGSATSVSWRMRARPSARTPAHYSAGTAVGWSWPSSRITTKRSRRSTPESGPRSVTGTTIRRRRMGTTRTRRISTRTFRRRICPKGRYRLSHLWRGTILTILVSEIYARTLRYVEMYDVIDSYVPVFITKSRCTHSYLTSIPFHYQHQSLT